MLAGTQKPMLGMKLNRAHPLADGLVGCWLFNEGVGNKAYDTSGYGNHGTLEGMASPPTAASGWNPGRKGHALAFDGSNDYVNCGNDPSLNISDAITIEAWVKFDDLTTSGGRLTHKNGAYSLFIHTADYTLQFHNYNDGTYGFSTASYTENEWQYVVIVKSGSAVNFYRNAVDVTNDGTISATLGVSAVDLIIGIDEDFNIFPFKGSIDGVKIYNRALSAEEIKWSYRESYAMFERGELLL